MGSLAAFSHLVSSVRFLCNNRTTRKFLTLVLISFFVLPMGSASAESDDVPPEVQEEVDEYTEAYIACFPNGAPDTWDYSEHGFEDCLDGDPNGPYNGWDPCNLAPNWWDEETNGVYNQLMDCGWDPSWGDKENWDYCELEPEWWDEEIDGVYPQIADCDEWGPNTDEAARAVMKEEWDYCKPPPDWWDEEIDGVYPQIADCGWEGFPPDEEEEPTPTPQKLIIENPTPDSSVIVDPDTETGDKSGKRFLNIPWYWLIPIGLSILFILQVLGSSYRKNKL